MARPKGMGYTPDTFDQQFLKVLSDLQHRGIELAKNEKRLEKLLRLTPANIYKIKNSVTGIGKPRRNEVVKQMQLLFDVNPMFFADSKENMYNGSEPKVATLPPEDYGNLIKGSSIMTAGDHIELQQLRIQVGLQNDKIKALELQLKSYQEQIATLNKLIAIYEKTGNFSAKES
jgi:hypothetical protein